ncbi:MAG: DUF4397 domain-containing protein [Gemmatimonadales bacterium]
MSIAIARAAAAAAALVLGSAVAACGDSHDDDSSGPEGPTAEVRLFTGASTSPALDLLVGDVTVAAGVPYGDATAPITIPAGVQSLEVRGAVTGVVVGSVDATLTEGGEYALTAGGSALNLVTPATVDTGAAQPDKANIRIVVSAPPFVDSASAPPPAPLSVHIAPPGTLLIGRTPDFSLDARFLRPRRRASGDAGAGGRRVGGPGGGGVTSKKSVRGRVG